MLRRSLRRRCRSVSVHIEPKRLPRHTPMATTLRYWDTQNCTDFQCYKYLVLLLLRLGYVRLSLQPNLTMQSRWCAAINASTPHIHGSIFQFSFYPFLFMPYSYGVEVFIFLWIYKQSAGLHGWVIGPSQGLYLNTGQHTHRKTHAHTHTKHPCPPASERAKTVHALDRAATVTG
jgi:hypothetical protein